MTRTYIAIASLALAAQAVQAAVPARIQAERAARGLAPKSKIGPGPKNPLGTRWIGFGDGSYGIHGTLDPGSIKRYASHGCVRMNNAHVTDLFNRVKVGTPVHVLYQPVLLAHDGRAIWLEAFPDFYHRGYDYRAAIAALADQGGFRSRLHNPAIEAALKAKDGLLLDVSQALAPRLPLVRVTPAKPAGGAGPATSKHETRR